MARFSFITLSALLVMAGCQVSGGVARETSSYTAFAHPERVTIRGYKGHAMEPFVTRDGRYLFFNNSNDPSVNTNLHYAERLDGVTFEYKGEIAGVNTPALEGVPTMDSEANFYFVSTRSYDDTLSTIFRGRFSAGAVTGVAAVGGISEMKPGHVNFDVEVSADGNTLYFVDGVFRGKAVPDTADIAVAKREGAEFRRLKNSAELLGNINTGSLEYAPCISQDELELFFTRLSTDGPVICRSTRNNTTEPFGLPSRVVAIEGFVEAPSLSPDGRSLYYHRKDGGVFTVFRVTRSK